MQSFFFYDDQVEIETLQKRTTQMETVRQYLLFFGFKNFFRKFLIVPAVVLLLLVPVHLSAKVGEGEKDSAAIEASTNEDGQIQDPVNSNSQKPVLYISEGVTVFALNHLSDNVEIVVSTSDKAKIPLSKVKKKNSIAVQIEKKAQKAKKYSNKAVAKTFYSVPLSDSEILFSKNSHGNSVFSPNHNFAIYSNYAPYYLLHLKQYDTIFISYKSAFSTVQYHLNFSVRPPPFSS